MLLFRLFFVFLKIGVFTIGSGYSMLVLAQRYIVDTYKWLTPKEFSDIIAIAEITPGPLIVNLATFTGSKIAGIKGAFFATLGLIFIPFLLIYIITISYIKFSNFYLVQKILKIIRPIAIGLIIAAIINLFKLSIGNFLSVFLLLITIFLVYFLKVNPIFLIIGGLFLAILLK